MTGMSTKYDISISDPSKSDVEFSILGKSQDSPYMLFQRVWVLLLCGGSGYRKTSTVDLLELIRGKNQIQDQALDSILAVACAAVMNNLDSEDRQKISNLAGTCKNGKILLTLTLSDGTKLSGSL